jgi:hypothetical protein
MSLFVLTDFLSPTPAVQEFIQSQGTLSPTGRKEKTFFTLFKGPARIKPSASRNNFAARR